MNFFLQSWFDFIFPPLCAICKEKCETKLFCKGCWGMCASPDPLEKCPHCFEDSDGLCRKCKQKPLLAFARSFVFEPLPPPLHLAKKREDLLASFAVMQWIRLNWLFPDVVIPMPKMDAIALCFSEKIQTSYANILKHSKIWTCDAKTIETDQILLVIDRGSSLEDCQEAVKALSLTFPKRGYLLSLFPYDSSFYP